ncbi:MULTISPECIES: hypothetical protein [unclassified Asaia]|uniref:hypothetical protein n=1 Tax=unclassified Asaia TaxID=2685023 RepID=UPI0013152786|nr:hypothetical protein [Asaia sp. W19]
MNNSHMWCAFGMAAFLDLAIGVVGGLAPAGLGCLLAAWGFVLGAWVSRGEGV